jgi:Cation/multidrug efflux pump
MILADVCVRRPVFATMLVGSLVVVGWFSYKSLTLDLFEGRYAGSDGDDHAAGRWTGGDGGASHQADRRSH